MRIAILISLLFMALPAEAKPLAARVHEAVEAVCPIEGVSLEDAADKKTWRIDFKKAATDEQKKAAKDVVKDFDLEDPEVAAKKTASKRLENAIKGDDQAEVLSALKEALKSGAIKLEK